MRKTDTIFNVYGFNAQSKKAPMWARIARRCYANQKTRCYNKKVREYSTYGARGLQVEYSLLDFLGWFRANVSDEQIRKHVSGQARISVGRINHSRGYSLGNIQIESISDNSKERIRRLGTPCEKARILATCKSTGEMVLFVGIRSVAKKFSRAPQNVSFWLKTGKTPKNIPFTMERV